MGTEKHVNSAASAENCVADGGSAYLAEISQPKESTTFCSACGHEVRAFHRLKHDGVARHFCSPCVLFLYKGMYCCLCFVVYETPAAKGPSSLWVSCTRCQRIAHERCARDRELLVDSLYFACTKCPQSKQISAQISRCSTEGAVSPPLKRLRSSVDDHNDYSTSPDDTQNADRVAEEVLAAAQIIALLTVQNAKDAKARARASAAVAARAAASAKGALDTAYRVAQQEARWKLDPSRRLSGVLPGRNAGLSAAINAPRNSRIDEGASIHDPLSYTKALPNKDQTGKGHGTGSYIPLNAHVATQHDGMKAAPPGAEVKGAQHPSGAYEKPRRLHVQDTTSGLQNGGPGVEAEAADINASPASILDAAASLDMPRPSSLEEMCPGQCNEVAATSDVPSNDCLPANGAQLQHSEDQILSSDHQKAENVDDSAKSFVKEVVQCCMTDVEGMDVSSSYLDKEQTGDVPQEVSGHKGHK